jgi:hypothetical protein
MPEPSPDRVEVVAREIHDYGVTPALGDPGWDDLTDGEREHLRTRVAKALTALDEREQGELARLREGLEAESVKVNYWVARWKAAVVGETWNDDPAMEAQRLGFVASDDPLVQAERRGYCYGWDAAERSSRRLSTLRAALERIAADGCVRHRRRVTTTDLEKCHGCIAKRALAVYTEGRGDMSDGV